MQVPQLGDRLQVLHHQHLGDAGFIEGRHGRRQSDLSDAVGHVECDGERVGSAA